MSPNDPLTERAQQQIASRSAQDGRLSDSAPSMPPLRPALRRVLAPLTYAQRQELLVVRHSQNAG